MQKICLLILLSSFMFFHGIAQTKYTASDERTSTAAIDLAHTDGNTAFGLQYGISRKGRLAFGLFASMDDSKNVTKDFGIYGEGAILKPSEESMIGLNASASFSLLWHNVAFGEKSYTGNGISIGGEFYLLPLESHFSPFISCTRSYVKMGTDNDGSISNVSYIWGLGCDYFITSNSTPRVIMTPEIGWTEQQTLLEINVAVVLSRSHIK
jgi:hypothetical protein